MSEENSKYSFDSIDDTSRRIYQIKNDLMKINQKYDLEEKINSFSEKNWGKIISNAKEWKYGKISTTPLQTELVLDKGQDNTPIIVIIRSSFGVKLTIVYEREVRNKIYKIVCHRTGNSNFDYSNEGEKADMTTVFAGAESIEYHTSDSFKEKYFADLI